VTTGFTKRVDEELEPLGGLTEDEAASRLASYGRNVIHEPRSRTVRDIALGTLREPMFLLLLAAAALYLAIGDLAEGIFLSCGALLSLGLVIIQEVRSERALRALNALAEPQARVIRQGTARSIPSSDIVPGDIIIIGEGGRVPADAILIDGDALEVDESALTGESVPRTKRPAGVTTAFEDMQPAGEELTSSLFASTLIVRGQGVARIVRTGPATQVGRIGVELGQAVEAPTLVQRDVRRLIGIIGTLAIAFCLLVAAVYAVLRNDWLAGALSGLTLAISLVPEEFPMVLTIFMALGALRLARHNVLVRRSAVIETLGATTLLCVDKTGTLTENRMSLRYVWQSGQRLDLSSGETRGAEPVLRAAQLASAPRPHDPMDVAVHNACGTLADGIPIRSYPLHPDFLAFVQVWPAPDSGVLYAAKGAHETILPLCDEAEAVHAAAAAHDLGALGLRVLAVATARFAQDPNLPPMHVHYQLQGLLGFEDPVRGDVPDALAEARRAGIEVVMITGDFPETALASARAAGLSATAGVITGSDLARAEKVPIEARIFARILPDQKLNLVKAFKQAGHVTAMTGDGINDAPALAAADIGIAMGQRGTDVAREAADLILLDDRFASIVHGIALGRRIFANLRRAMTYITAIHIPVAGLALLPILLSLPPMLYPMHLVILELLIDPLCSIVFEGEPSEADSMRKPPRDREEKIFGAPELSLAIVQGAVLLASVFAFYAWLTSGVADEEVARAAAFVALITGHLSLALAEKSSSGAPIFSRTQIVFWSIAAGATIIVGAALTIPFFLEILRFAPPPAPILALSLMVGLLSGGWYAGARLTKRGPSAKEPLTA
jgi:Ca2+-transporting ATPase